MAELSESEESEREEKGGEKGKGRIAVIRLVQCTRDMGEEAHVSALSGGGGGPSSAHTLICDSDLC